MPSAAVTTSEETVNGLFLLFGLSLGFAAEFWIGMGSIQIKYSHKLNAETTNKRPPYCRGRWWFGFFLLLLNGAFNFASYMFASLNILAPTSALLIVINAILARIYFNEQLTFFGYVGSICIMIGCVLSIIFGTHSQDQLKIDNLFIKADTYQFILFATIHGGLCIIFGVIGSTNLQTADDNNHNMNIDVHESEMELINADDEEVDDEQKMEESPAQNTDSEEDGRALISNLETSSKELAEIGRKEESKHVVRCFLLGFATAGLVSWAQFLGKIAADFFFETLWNGNNQFTSIKPWSVGMILCVLCVFEVYLMSEIMRIFDLVLIIPIYNSLQILSTISLSAVYFDNFRDWNVTDSLLFCLGLFLIFSGIVFVSQGQKHQSMEHYVSDEKTIFAAKSIMANNMQ